MVLALAENLDVKESMPRAPKNTMHRDNPPSNTATEYYKRSISIPLVNHLQTQLNDRFTESTTVCVNAFKIVPGVMVSPLYLQTLEKIIFRIFLFIHQRYAITLLYRGGIRHMA